MIAAVASEKHRGFEGMTVAQIAQSQQRRPVVVALDLLVQERLQVAAIFFTMCEDDVRTVLSYAHTSIGSDASVRSVGGITARGKPHPRAFGTFPRIFKRYVRDSRLLTLEEAVRRATRLPATRLGLRDRGELREGWHADIVAFDPATIADMSTYEDPYRYPVGLSHVFVNGVAVVRDGLSTGSKGGRVLRRGRDL
jgi:N-acyl-D-amino-acid deacylase